MLWILRSRTACSPRGAIPPDSTEQKDTATTELKTQLFPDTMFRLDGWALGRSWWHWHTLTTRRGHDGDELVFITARDKVTVHRSQQLQQKYSVISLEPLLTIQHTYQNKNNTLKQQTSRLQGLELKCLIFSTWRVRIQLCMVHVF